MSSGWNINWLSIASSHPVMPVKPIDYLLGEAGPELGGGGMAVLAGTGRGRGCRGGGGMAVRAGTGRGSGAAAAGGGWLRLRAGAGFPSSH